MLKTIREFGREQLAHSGDENTIRQQHFRYYLTLIEQAQYEASGLYNQDWGTQLEAEHDNFQAALQWTLDSNTADLEQYLSGALWKFWCIHRHLAEGKRWIKCIPQKKVVQELLRLQM